MSEEKLETYSDEGIECPHCGYVHEDSGDGENYNESMETYECPRCERNLNVSASCSWSWTAEERTEQDILDDIERETANGQRCLDVSEDMRKHYEGRNPYQHKIDDLQKELEELRVLNSETDED